MWIRPRVGCRVRLERLTVVALCPSGGPRFANMLAFL